MENLFKKFIYTGVGFVSLTTEKMMKTVENLISENKISEDEGKRIIDDLLESTDSKKDELESQFKNIINNVVESFHFATKKDLEKLENRIAVLEALVAKKDNPTRDKE